MVRGTEAGVHRSIYGHILWGAESPAGSESVLSRGYIDLSASSSAAATPSILGDLLPFIMPQPSAQPIHAHDVLGVDVPSVLSGVGQADWSAAQTAVRPNGIVVVDEFTNEIVEVVAVGDDEMAQAFPLDGSDERLGVAVHLRGQGGTAHDGDPFGLKDVVESIEELAVAVSDNMGGALSGILQVHAEIPRLLGSPGTVGVGGHSGQPDPARPDLLEEARTGLSSRWESGRGR